MYPKLHITPGRGARQYVGLDTLINGYTLWEYLEQNAGPQGLLLKQTC